MYRVSPAWITHVVVGWVLVTISVVSTVGLTVFSVLGAKGSSSFGTGTLVITAVIVLLLATMLVAVTAPLILTPVALPVLRVSRRIIHHPVEPHEAWQRLRHEARASSYVVMMAVLFARSGEWAAD